MPFCSNCGKEVLNVAKFCYACGADLTTNPPVNPDTNNKTPQSSAVVPLQKKQGFGQINQSRAAVYTAIGIIFLIDILSIVSLITEGADRPGTLIGTIIFDVLLGIFLFIGKKWSRTWMLIRSVIGLVVWSIVYTANGDFSSVIIQIGYCVSVILLLTGRSTGLRIGGSIALFLISFLISMFLTL
jgi:hypothetical protein